MRRLRRLVSEVVLGDPEDAAIHPNTDLPQVAATFDLGTTKRSPGVFGIPQMEGRPVLPGHSLRPKNRDREGPDMKGDLMTMKESTLWYGALLMVQDSLRP